MNRKEENKVTELGTGEALISTLDEDGKPGIVQRAMVIAPACSMGSAPDDAKRYIIDNNDLRTKYAESVNRESEFPYNACCDAVNNDWDFDRITESIQKL